jgi:hypothetical protein
MAAAHNLPFLPVPEGISDRRPPRIPYIRRKLPVCKKKKLPVGEAEREKPVQGGGVPNRLFIRKQKKKREEGFSGPPATAGLRWL